MLTTPYFAVTFQRGLYWSILACYGIALLSFSLELIDLSFTFFLGLLGQAILGLLQFWINLVRGILNKHRLSLSYALLAVLYVIVIFVIKPDFSTTGYQNGIELLTLFVFPLLLATFAIFVIDPAYHQYTPPTTNVLDDPF